MTKEVKVNLLCSKSCCKCYVCGRNFGKDPSRTLKKHLLSHVKSSLCAICGKSVVTLSMHERRFHFPKVYVDSEQTTARLSPKKRKVTLKKTPKLSHKTASRQKRKRIPPKWQCSTCGKMYQNAVQLKDHNFTHTNEKPYQCQICGKSFNVRYNCQKHKMRVHSKTLYHCDLCGNGFKSVPSLQVHVRKHSGERPYKCLECDKSFLIKPHLNRHLYVHGKERPFKCTVCNKGYTSNYELQNHIVSHSKKD